MTVNKAVILTADEIAPSLRMTSDLHVLHFSPFHIRTQDDALGRFRNHHGLLIAHSRNPWTRYGHRQITILVRCTRLHQFIISVAVGNRFVVAVVWTAL